MTRAANRDDDERDSGRGDPSDREPDFFEQVIDEVAAARRAGRQFAPGAIESTLAQPERRTG